MVRYVLKMTGSFLAAFFVINILCYFYYNPAIQINNEKAYTDCKNEPSPHNWQCTEGYGNVLIDDNGFNNGERFDCATAKILCIGSSQTEAQNVFGDENYVYLLNDMQVDRKAYNLGVSAQRFSSAFYRISALKENFPACKALIFEVNSLPTREELLSMREYMEHDEIPLRDLSWKNSNKIVKIVSRIPLFRLLWSQYDHKKKAAHKVEEKNEQTVLADDYRDLANDVIILAKKQAQGVPIIIFNLPRIKLQEGELLVVDDNGAAKAMNAACELNGVLFVDMGAVFVKEYNEKRVLPYGFINGPVGSGHLNAEGHRMIAETLDDILLKRGL